jgi:transposase
MEDRIEMSAREREVLKVMSGVLRGERTQREAARLLKKSERQVRRIQRRLEVEGDRSVVHRLRGRPSNHRCEPHVRQEVLEAYRQDYGDFGPTLASEKLRERGYEVSVDSLRRWLMEAGLWERKRRREQHRSRRERRECLGELVQLDASHHDWLEGRSAEPLVLLATIDDATGRITARFYAAETTEAYMDLFQRYLQQHGRPVALYTDHDSVFEAQEKGHPVPGRTQFSRALQELDVELILANSPQAKGRVERLFRTLQDRWVKELRLEKVVTRDEANALLDQKLIREFNRKFRHRPQSPNDAHRALTAEHDLPAILSFQTSRRVNNDYTVRLRNRLYQLHKPAWPGLRGGRVVLEERRDGTLAIRFKKRYLKYTEIAAEARAAGALPPHPRSLSRRQHPAESSQKKTTRVEPLSTRATAVTLTDERSGCTPAEPYPSAGKPKVKRNRRYRPSKNHPWKRGLKKLPPLK